MTGDTEGLGQVLEEQLTAHFGRPCVVTALRRESYVYSTSFALDELEVRLQDGACLRLILKDLGVGGLLEDARTSKPAFLYEPRREIDTYRRILSRARLGTATCYGAVTDSDLTRYWLFLEKVEGRELYQIGDVDVWQDVARWLAEMHGDTLLDAETAQEANPHLLRYDADFYHRWLDRATSFIGDSGSADQQRTLTAVGKGLEAALKRLADMPTAFVHGEFYASNVIVAQRPERRRVCPVDWEMAGIGPSLLDLAALCTGWDNENRRALARCYQAACTAGDAWPPEEEEFMMLLQGCQLCLAVQWLGWAPGWVAPPEHARDWLAEASRLAEGLAS